MTALETAEGLARPLEMSHSQLRRYAADMKQVVEAERKRSRELAAANARLALLDRLKSDFLTFISHELRTPLNHMSAVDLLDPEASEEEQAEAVSMIREGYERLNALIQRGLDYLYWVSREPGSATGSVSWPDALEAAASRLCIPVEFERPGQAVPVIGDAGSLTAAFAELIGNARKHGPGGWRNSRDRGRAERPDPGPSTRFRWISAGDGRGDLPAVHAGGDSASFAGQRAGARVGPGHRQRVRRFSLG